MKITYKEKEYELKYSFRVLMIYENITNKSFEPKTLTDMITLFYSAMLVAGKGEYIDYEEFIDWLDDNPEQMTLFSEWLNNIFNLNHKLAPKKEETENTNKENEHNPN